MGVSWRGSRARSLEFGPLNDSIHKIDEHVRIADLEPLSAIYERTIRAVWERFPPAR